MPSDLNKMMLELQDKNSSLRKELSRTLGSYDDFLREGNRILIEERTASNNYDELGDFIRLMNIIKRNRDVIGSLYRGINSLRSMSGFKFIVEDVKR